MRERIAKGLWILNVTVLAAVAYFLASGTGDLLASELASELPRLETAILDNPPQNKSRATMRARRSSPNGTPILERNLFDSETGPIIPGAAPSEQLSEQGTSDPGELPVIPCAEAGDVDVRLEATIVSPGSPRWSFASVEENRESRLCRVGDTVSDRTVAEIGWSLLFLRGDEDVCYLGLFDEPEDKSGKRRRHRRHSGKLSRKDIRSGIEKAGPNKRIIDREVFRRVLANPSKFVRSVRVRPYKRNGEVKGFRLRRVKRRSPLKMLGARKGDIVHSVNGRPLDSVNSALALYNSLKSQDDFVFSITRKGKPMELEVSVR